MKIEIWSDVMCPFCYIGKRRFEKALSQFEHKEHVEVEWKSFQLNPDMKTQPGRSIHQYLAEIKGWSVEHAKQLNQHVTNMAEAEGLHYDLDKAVLANSFDAHRFAHLAKQQGKGNEAEEVLFKGYFTEGANIADHVTLAEMGNMIGIDRQLVMRTLEAKDLTAEVRSDIAEAHDLGVTGVPFFVFNRNIAVSGAQPAECFLQALQQSWNASKAKNSDPAG